MPQQKPSWITTPDPEWRTRRPMTLSEAKQIIAKNLKEAKAGVEIPDLTIKPLPEPTMEEAEAALKKALKTRRQYNMPQQKPKSQTQGELKLAEGKNKPTKIKYTPTPDLFTKAKGKKEDWRPEGATQESFSLEYPGRAEREAARAAERAKLAEQQRIDSMQKKFSFMEEKPLRSGKGRGALGVALAAMGGAGMADEAWAAGMDKSNVKRTGGGRGTYQPPIRRSAFNVREQ